MLRGQLFILLVFLIALEDIPAAAGHHSFSLTIQERRLEQVVTPGESETVPADFETRIVLHGRVDAPEGARTPLTICNDSLRVDTTVPFPFESFMSRDTLFYRAEGKPDVQGKRIDALLDSMLQCVFEGPALSIAAAERSGNPVRVRAVTDLKPECGSGEYSRLKMPVTLGFFFPGLPEPAAGFEWRERKILPSFSGLHFFPELEISLRIVEISERDLTIVFRADTTFEDLHLTMPNGEEIGLIRDAVHIGGTLFIDRRSGMTTRGEVRIEEDISYLRQRISIVPASKDCSYVLRLKTW